MATAPRFAPVLAAEGSLFDCFLKLDGIDGEASDSKHKGEIEISTFSFGAAQSGSHAFGTGGGVGKVQLQDFHFLTRVNKSSPKLFKACASGQHIKSALLTCRKAGGDQQEYLKIKFTDLLVSSYQSNGTTRGEVHPMDQVTLNFAKIEIEYHEQKPDGSLGGAINGGWDAKVNKAI